MFEAKAKASDSAADKSTSELSCAGTVLRDYSAQGTYQEAAQTPKPSKGQLNPGPKSTPLGIWRLGRSKLRRNIPTNTFRPKPFIHDSSVDSC